MQTGRGILTKPLIIGNQYAQEFEPEVKEQKQANNVTPNTPSGLYSPTPAGQITTDSYQRLQASPPPPVTQPYVPPGMIFMIYYYYVRASKKPAVWCNLLFFVYLFI